MLFFSPCAQPITPAPFVESVLVFMCFSFTSERQRDFNDVIEHKWWQV